MKNLLLLSVILFFSTCVKSQQNKLVKATDCRIITEISLEHCQKGIQRCKKCKEIYARKYALLNICPEGPTARPTVEITRSGKTEYLAYEVLQSFETFAAASDFSVKENIFLYDKNEEIRDEMIEKLKKRLPPGWELSIEHDILKISRKESVIALFENMINAPVRTESETALENRIKTTGKSIACYMEFFLETKWFPEKKVKIEAHNAALAAQISSLPKKYKIQNLKHFDSKTGIVYQTENEEQRKSVEEYENERNQLEKQFIKIPDYISEHYCLYFLKQQGIGDEYTLVSPQSATQEAYSIRSIMRDLMGVEK
jgi:hypothetical protein